MVKREALLWGDSVTQSYFEVADEDMDRQWAVVEPFLSQIPIDYRNTLDLACGHGRNSAKLSGRVKSLTLVDVNPENIAFCKQRFRDARFSFVINNGYDLSQIDDCTITFLYCLESAVHFDLEIVLSYIKEFNRILVPGGVGFVHHSNYTKTPGAHFFTNWHGRNFMSKDIFAHLCIRNGLEIIDQKILSWGGDEADCFSLFRNTTGYLRPSVTLSAITTEDKRSAEPVPADGLAAPRGKGGDAIQVFEPATPDTLNTRRYLLANNDLRIAFGEDETRARHHFSEFGFKEDRRQFTQEYLLNRRDKFYNFKSALLSCTAMRFPIVFGRRFYSLESPNSDMFNGKCDLWDVELGCNPGGLYVEFGAGVRQTIKTNCVYIDQKASLTADVIVEISHALPFKNAVIDGVGFFTTTDKLNEPLKTVAEIDRILKPTGKIIFQETKLSAVLSALSLGIDHPYTQTLDRNENAIVAMKSPNPNTSV